MFNQRILLVPIILIALSAKAQFRLLPSHTDAEDRLISLDFNKLESNRYYLQTPELIGSLNKTESKLSEEDWNSHEFNYFSLNFPEYSKNQKVGIAKSSFLQYFGKAFMKNPNRFYSWESKDRKDYLVVNPVLDLLASPKLGMFDTALLNGRGVEVYGQMGKRVAFYTRVFDYQASYPFFIDVYRQQNKVTPGIGKYFTNTYGFTDYFYATGYFTANIISKSPVLDSSDYFINLSAGHDKQFIGSGFRSLLLSNFAPPSLFLRLNSKLGPFKYQNIYKELVRDMSKDTNRMLNRKYLAMHRGSLDFSEIGLELGFSEMIIHSRPDNSFDINYLNPIIFYRAVERDMGSNDNALIGFDAKYTRENLVVYGQLLIDEFNFNSIVNNRNSYLNKNAWQLGVYFKLSPLNNLFKQHYFQVEANSVRPFTYSHNTSSYYSHYSQSLAHPLESNFRELVIKFFAIPQKQQRLDFKVLAILSTRGINTDSLNYGSDIRLNYRTAQNKDFAPMLQGKPQNRLNLQIDGNWRMTSTAKIGLNYMWSKAIGYQSFNTNYLNLYIKWNFLENQEQQSF